MLLLTIGVLGALQGAFIMFGLSMQFGMMGEVLDIKNFAAPAWLDTGGKVAGVAVLAFYALVLVYSVRRLRSGKLTFWVPLVAGVIVLIAVFIISAIALTSSPPLMAALADPDASAKLLEYLQSMQAPAK